MLSAKVAQSLARATRNRGSLAYRQARRRQSAGQSIIVAIIVLFLLLFLGGIFIALIANNLRNTRRGIQASNADKFAQAGIQYLDQQLMNSPEGADWRPIPRCLPNGECQIVGGPRQLSPNDPDYYWLKQYDPATDQGGYNRINFGGPIPSRTNLGGRALVRVTYRPYRVDPATGAFWDDLNGNGTYDSPAETVSPTLADRTRRYIRLESVGRVGNIDELDPTTYKNTEGLGLRRELVAYKALGLTESLRFITDKDQRRVPATLGAPYPVKDRASDRFIYSVYQGAIRSNTDLTFYGLNYLSFDSRRGDALEVSGPIGLDKVDNNTTTLTGTDSTKVYIRDVATGTPGATVASLNPTIATPQVGTVYPSNSASFTTFNGLIRDNPRGSETQNLPDAANNNNLRAVPRQDPPLIDSVIGDNGLTRYRELTRDSAPMAPSQMPPNTLNIDRRYAGAYGWGQNLYIPNAVDLPVFSDAVGNVTSQRAEWLNSASNGTLAPNWKSDSVYAPNAVTITLTPRWFTMSRSSADNRTRSYLRRPGNGGNIAQQTVARYTYDATGAMATAPSIGLDDTDGATSVAAEKYAGYPATLVTAGYYEGDFIIFAEGNVRIKGVAGGYDPETKKTFVRHLTVVSNGTVYVDGSLLRDNISPGMAGSDLTLRSAKGKSTIALLAKNYIAVNTTQFLSPSLPPDLSSDTDADGSGTKTPLRVALLKASTSRATARQEMSMLLGPVTSYDAQGLPIINNVFNGTLGQDINTTPVYLGMANSLSLLVRHAPSEDGPVSMNLFVNTFLNGTAIEEHNFASFVLGVPGATPPTPRIYTDNVYPLNPTPNSPTDYLFTTNGYPYVGNGGGTAANLPAVGINNKLALQVDAAGGGVNYNIARFGVVPLDVRIEALMYAQEGSFYIIPGPWFNPNSNDTYAQFISRGNRRAEQDTSGANIVDPRFPFYGEPLDVRITLFGSITENLPAEIGDQGAWLQKWGWVPEKYGSTGLTGTPTQGTQQFTFHGPTQPPSSGMPVDGVGSGINYIYDPRLASPYDASGVPLRMNTNFTGLAATQMEPLPPMPRLPVAPGLLFYGERPIQ